VVELRRILLLPQDDLLALIRQFICPRATRAGLDRCLRRHGIGNLGGHRLAQPAPARCQWRTRALCLRVSAGRHAGRADRQVWRSHGGASVAKHRGWPELGAGRATRAPAAGAWPTTACRPRPGWRSGAWWARGGWWPWVVASGPGRPTWALAGSPARTALLNDHLGNALLTGRVARPIPFGRQLAQTASGHCIPLLAIDKAIRWNWSGAMMCETFEPSSCVCGSKKTLQEFLCRPLRIPGEMS